MKLYDALVTVNQIPASACCTKEEEQALTKVIEAATKYYAKQIPDKPLTVKQLKRMDGEPVWIDCFNFKNLSGWRIIDCKSIPDRVRMWGTDGSAFETNNGYGKTWLAYARPPEAGEKG